MPTAPLQRSKTLPTRPLVDHRWRPVLLKDRILVVEQYLALQTSGQVTCNTLLWPLLSWMGGQTSSIWSINWLYQAPAPICFVPTIFFNLHCQQAFNPYFLDVRRWWLRITGVGRMIIWPWLNYMVISNVYWKPEIVKDSKTWYTGSVLPFQWRWTGFPLGTFPT